MSMLHVVGLKFLTKHQACFQQVKLHYGELQEQLLQNCSVNDEEGKTRKKNINKAKEEQKPKDRLAPNENCPGSLPKEVGILSCLTMPSLKI